jgi:uncharacterized protein (TIGR02145 family)
MKYRNLLVFVFGVLTLFGCKKNNPPEIIEITVSPMNAPGGTTLTISALAVDEDQDLLSYLWICESGMFIEGATSAQTKWKAPVSLSDEVYSMKVIVSDAIESVSMSTLITIGKSATGSISGFVYFSGCTLPISGVRVTVNDKSATTDSDGYFLIDGIPVGETILVANKEDYDTVSTEITVSLEDKGEELFVFMTSPKFSAKIFGTVTGDLTGAPKPGLIVMVLNPDGSDSNLKSITNSSGSYQLPPVPLGERTLIVKVSEMVVYEADILLDKADYQYNLALPEPFEFTDTRDGNQYQALKIGTQTWMTRNLAYLPTVSPSSIGSGSSPYYYVYAYEGNSVEDAIAMDYMYKDYGVLYNWEAAKTACPEGWHLPGDAEWKTLEMYCGLSPLEVDAQDLRNSGRVGMKLKSTAGWNRNHLDGSSGNGDNSSGFTILPGGSRDYSPGFLYQGDVAYFWSSDAWVRAMSNSDDGVLRRSAFYGNGFSVRCIKNNI